MIWVFFHPICLEIVYGIGNQIAVRILVKKLGAEAEGRADQPARRVLKMHNEWQCSSV